METFFYGYAFQMLRNIALFTTGHLRVENPQYAKEERTLPVDLSVFYDASVRDKLLKIKGIKEVCGRIDFGVLFYNKGKTATCLGKAVEPFDPVYRKLKIHGKRPGPGEMIVGAGLVALFPTCAIRSWLTDPMMALLYVLGRVMLHLVYLILFLMVGLLIISSIYMIVNAPRPTLPLNFR